MFHTGKHASHIEVCMMVNIPEQHSCRWQSCDCATLFCSVHIAAYLLLALAQAVPHRWLTESAVCMAGKQLLLSSV